MSLELDGIRIHRMDGGWELLTGKTARDNDRLSVRIGKPADFWFHAAGVAGAHVVARHPDRPGQCPREVKRIAGGLAAFYSKARAAKRAVVHWTTCANVSKRRGAPAGQVTLRKFDVLHVEPVDPGEYFGD